MSVRKVEVGGQGGRKGVREVRGRCGGGGGDKVHVEGVGSIVPRLFRILYICHDAVRLALFD